MTGMIWAVIAAAGIPSALFAWFLSRMTKKLDERDKARQEKEEAQLKHDLMLIELVMAAITLGEATAEAVQRIPDAHCNGNMHEALQVSREARAKYRAFEREQAAKALQ